jgi:predicted glycoside hydrolase/deacetylase ChbG (UPF0249 family)
MRYLIINADDFGYSATVNAAVLRAHREGVLTSASLMVAEPGCEEAVETARQTPTLGVGLHLAVTYDHALLPPRDIPLLADAQGKFGADPFRVGLRYSFSKGAQAQLRREMEAQFARFAQFGLDWSHADGHQHFHMHPVIWDTLLDLCDAYGVHRLRVPHEDLRAHFGGQAEEKKRRREEEKKRGTLILPSAFSLPPSARGDGPNLNTVATLFLRAMRRRNLRVLRARRTLGGKPVFLCDRVYGQLQTGNMNTAYTLRLLDRLQYRASEIYFHPGTPHARALPAALQSNGIRDVELQTLLDPAVRARIEALELQTGTYAQIEMGVNKMRVNKSAFSASAR